MLQLPRPLTIVGAAVAVVAQPTTLPWRLYNHGKYDCDLCRDAPHQCELAPEFVFFGNVVVHCKNSHSRQDAEARNDLGDRHFILVVWLVLVLGTSCFGCCNLILMIDTYSWFTLFNADTWLAVNKRMGTIMYTIPHHHHHHSFHRLKQQPFGCNSLTRAERWCSP